MLREECTPVLGARDHEGWLIEKFGLGENLMIGVNLFAVAPSFEAVIVDCRFYLRHDKVRQIYSPESKANNLLSEFSAFQDGRQFCSAVAMGDRAAH